MPTPQIKIGPVEALVQNIAYALPARQVRVISIAAVEVSVDGSSWATLANSTTGTDCTAVFVRCTTGNTSLVARV